MYNVQYLKDSVIRSLSFNRLDLADRVAQTMASIADDSAAYVYRRANCLRTYVNDNSQPAPRLFLTVATLQITCPIDVNELCAAPFGIAGSK